MDPPRRAFLFPDDVLRLILDSLWLKDILLVSRVCRAWRSVALDHPTYSRNINWHFTSQASQSPSGLGLFLRMLFHHHSKGNIAFLSLSISPSAHEPRLHVDWLKPFSAVRACLFRLEYLSLDLYDGFVAMAFHALAQPAPRLKELRLSAGSIWPKRSCSWILPQNLFAGHAPLLVTLRLYQWSFNLPLARAADPGTGQSLVVPLMALSRVKELRWNIYARNNENLRLECLFMHCPLLERLVLRCEDGISLHTAQAWNALPPPDVLNLRHLSFLGNAIHYYLSEEDEDEFAAWQLDVDAIVRALAHPRMESLEVNTNVVTMHTLLSILAHLGSDALHLEATTRDAVYGHLTLRSIPRGLERTFSQIITYHDQTDCDMFNECLAPLSSQIAQLTVHGMSGMWNVVTEILPPSDSTGAVLHSIERLTVILGFADGDDRENSDRVLDHRFAEEHGAFWGLHKLRLPALKCLELVGPPDLPLTACDLAYFMGNVLQRVARRELLLVLRGVTIEGDIRRIWGYFERIELFP